MLAVAVGLSLLGAAPVLAGGAVLQMDDFPIWSAVYAPGQIAHGETVVWIRPPRRYETQGRPEDGPYFGYLIPQRDHQRQFPLADNAIRVGSMEFEPYEPGATHTKVSITFEVPDIEPGKYWLEVCNDPCTKILGDLVGTSIEVARDPLHAAIRSEILLLDSKYERRAHVERRRINRRLSALEHELTELEATTASRIDALKEDLRKERVSRAKGSSMVSTASTAGAFLLLALFLVWRRRPAP